MTPQQLQAMKRALEALEYALNKPMWNRPKMTEAITALEEALAEHAMQEVQRLGQEIEQEPVAIDQATMELAESVGLIGPTSRTHDLHQAIQRFHDLICVNATVKAAQMAADVIRESTPPQRTWVGLTGLDQKELMAMSARDAVFATEAKLKEKNGV